ncbi:unnamed protein product [Schistosoma margrebowiei]|uniref:Uncharacterized protein n=1 Tax=Schistosoma margrebowiei TaxID=48269 RepID=A0A183LPJ6_9TREM|nr:unnamed protein product [Schistosoma margrebowiei]
MVVESSQQETLDPGSVLVSTRQEGVPVILRELVLPNGFDPMSHSFTFKDEKTTSVAATSTKVGFDIHKEKSKILRYNTACNNPVTIDGDFEDVKTFTYLGNITDKHGGSDAYMKAWISKARTAYLQLKDIRNSKQLSISQHQGRNFQYKCQHSSTVWSGNLENYQSHHPEDIRVY